MKNKFFLAIIFNLLLLSCSSKIKTLANQKQIDTNLVGIWAGSEIDMQEAGMKKEWEMNRKDDGTYEIDFVFYKDGEKDESSETGTWWVENGKFFELHDVSKQADVYDYVVIDKNNIKFKSVKMASTEMNTKSYEFIDTRKIDVNKNLKDGSSFENAIKVNSVPAEYKYIKKNCENCEILSQSLRENKGKFYDVISVKTSDGAMKDYFFDITSFFGKF
jgi:hypothetical protein